MLRNRYEKPAGASAADWPYTADNPFYLIINNAMKPGWAPAPHATLKENVLEVDYISVSQRV